MTVEQAHEFFSPVPVVARKLSTLLDVGLATSPWGKVRPHCRAVKRSGEAVSGIEQARHGSHLYILDEPTTGLHYHDIELLLKVLIDCATAATPCGDRT